MSKVEWTPNVGELVDYKNKAYWVYATKFQRVVIVPENAWDFIEGTIQLGQALEVDNTSLRPYEDS